jgi:thiol-disulfide isomerase/thioredoxin
MVFCQKYSVQIVKNKFAAILSFAALFLSVQRAFTADAKTELKALVSTINTDIAAGKRTENALADEVRQFDVLLAEHKGEKTDDVAQILYLKAMLYGEVFHDEAKAEELETQLKTDFKDTEFVAALEKHEAAAAAAQKIQDTLLPGTTFPDFNEKDVTGRPLSIANHKGRVVMIDFWATWCGPCRGELPNVIATYKKHHARGFDIIGVSLDQDQAKLTQYIKSMNITWPQFFDGQGWGNKLALKYGVESIPASFLLDGDGKIIGKDLRGEALEQAVTTALTAK